MNIQKIITLENETNKFFYSKLRIKNSFTWERNLFTFETSEDSVENSSEHGYNDIKHPYAYGEENIYFMLHQKYFPLQEYENSTVKNEHQYLYKKMKN